MSALICNAPFCGTTINKKSYVFCWVHRAEREKYSVRRMELVIPLWSVKNCKVHGHLRKNETLSSINPSGNNSPRCKLCKKITSPYCPIKGRIAAKRNRFRRRDQKLIKDYGITLEDYKKMNDSQNGKCAICNNSQCVFDKNSDKKRALAVDHNHKTGKVRELLCTSCNTAIGHFKEDIDLIKKAIKYLRRHETT